jgi:hypothetical protein
VLIRNDTSTLQNGTITTLYVSKRYPGTLQKSKELQNGTGTWFKTVQLQICTYYYSVHCEDTVRRRTEYYRNGTV